MLSLREGGCRARLIPGARLSFEEGEGDGDTPGPPFLATWQTEEPSAACAPAGMKDFFLTFWGADSWRPLPRTLPHALRVLWKLPHVTRVNLAKLKLPFQKQPTSNDCKSDTEVQRPDLLTLRRLSRAPWGGWLGPWLGSLWGSVSPSAPPSYFVSLLQVLIPRAHRNKYAAPYSLAQRLLSRKPTLQHLPLKEQENNH